MSVQLPDPLSLTCAEFMEASSLPRDEARAEYRLAHRGEAGLSVDPITSQFCEDQALKFLLRLEDGLESESVVLSYRGSTGRPRRTLCVSSQVGCAMGCTFCETAQMGLMRDMTVREIVQQWFAAHHVLGQPISNIVFMGMGEPLANPDVLEQAIRVLTDHCGPAIAPSRVTVSTVGRVEGIRRLRHFADAHGLRKLRLAVSVNAPNDEIRSQIMPVNRADSMAALREAIVHWRERVLIEYVLIPDLNDAREHAHELAAWLADLDCTVNVIPYNPRRDSPWPAPDEADVEAFVGWIADRGVRVRRRQTKGRDMFAACGQLGNERIRRRRWVESPEPVTALRIPSDRPSV